MCLPDIGVKFGEKLYEQFCPILLQVRPRSVDGTVLVFELDRRIVEVPPLIIEFDAQLLRLEIVIVVFDNVDGLVEFLRRFFCLASLGIRLSEGH